MKGFFTRLQVFVGITLLSTAANAGAAIPSFPNRLNWNYAEAFGFTRYEAVTLRKAIYNVERKTVPRIGFYAHTFSASANPRFKNPLYSAAQSFPAFPLMGKVPVQNKIGTVLAEPVPEITFFTTAQTPPTELPDLLDLLSEDHFIWIPPGSKIKMSRGPFDEITNFEFPEGTSFIHRIMLNDRAQTPLELRFSQRRNGAWYFGVYDDPEVLTAGGQSQTRVRIRNAKPGAIKEVPPFMSLSKGLVSFKYPMATSNDCLTCHMHGFEFRNQPKERVEGTLRYLQDLRRSGFASSWDRLFNTVVSEQVLFKKEQALADQAARRAELEGRTYTPTNVKTDLRASRLLLTRDDPALDDASDALFGPCGFGSVPFLVGLSAPQ